LPQALAEHAWDLDHWLGALECSLFEDLWHYSAADREGQDRLRQCALAYLPLANANAFAEPVPGAPGHYAMGLELSLYWVGYLLFIGLVLRFWNPLEQQADAPAGSASHPPALQRLAALHARVEERLGPPPNDAPRWAAAVSNDWVERLAQADGAR
jgi:hypothetical protein